MRQDFSWDRFTFSKMAHQVTQEQTGWGVTCGLHWDVTSTTNCKKAIRYRGQGKGAPIPDDNQCIIQLKRWILRGFRISRSRNARTAHIRDEDTRLSGPTSPDENLDAEPVIPAHLIPLPPGRGVAR